MKFSCQQCSALATVLLAVPISAGSSSVHRSSTVVDASRKTVAVSGACLSSGFETKVATCDLNGLQDAITAALTSVSCAHDAATELSLLFGGADPTTTACANPQDEPSKPFSSIADKGPLFDKEYMDGGTYWNQEREYQDSMRSPTDVLSDDPGMRIERIHADVASSTPIDLPEGSNFENCDQGAVMCCFVADRDPSTAMMANTDVCYHDLRHSPGSNHVQMGYALYGDDVLNTDVTANCHGFAWHDLTSYKYAGNVLFEISMYQNLSQEGRVRNVPGAPMCACVEQMPVVEKADCTEVTVGSPVYIFKYSADGQLGATKGYDLTYGACQSNVGSGTDLAGYYADKFSGGEPHPKFSAHVVGADQCEPATRKFLYSHGLQYKPL